MRLVQGAYHETVSTRTNSWTTEHDRLITRLAVRLLFQIPAQGLALMKLVDQPLKKKAISN